MSELVKDCKIEDLFSLKDQVVLVVGAGGLGEYIGRGMAMNGAKIVFTNTSIGKAEKVQAEMAKDGLSCDIYQLDVTNDDQVTEVVAKIAEKYGRIDAILNVAGISQSIKTLDMTLEAWNRMININLTGTFLTLKAAIPYMQKNGYGRIVNLATVSAKNGGGVFGGPHYIAAKSGVIGLTRALGKEFVRDGITVNCVAPGPCNTGLLDTDFTPMAAAIPAGRIAVPDDVAAAMVFLASEEAGYITGVTINVNGGSYMG